MTILRCIYVLVYSQVILFLRLAWRVFALALKHLQTSLQMLLTSFLLGFLKSHDWHDYQLIHVPLWFYPYSSSWNMILFLNCTLHCTCQFSSGIILKAALLYFWWNTLQPWFHFNLCRACFFLYWLSLFKNIPQYQRNLKLFTWYHGLIHVLRWLASPAHQIPHV